MPGTIPAPVVPTVPEAGGSFWAGGSASGMNQTSGITCDFSGPHCITTQTLGVNYHRNPSYQLSAISLGLSAGLINPTYKVNGTRILLQAMASVTVTKSYECYSTSAWTQNQTFAVNAVSADTYGNVYGTAAEFSSAYILGPAGSIETFQPYYERRPWDDTIDVESTSSVTLFNYQMTVRSMGYNSPYIVTSGTVDAMTEWGEMENGAYAYSVWKPDKWLGKSFLGDPGLGASWSVYHLAGGYTYGQESIGGLKSMMDYMVGNSMMRSSDQWQSFAWYQDGSASLGLPTYDWKRHDWSTIE